MCGNNAAFNGSPDGKNGVALALWRVKQKTVDRHAALGIVGRNGEVRRTQKRVPVASRLQADAACAIDRTTTKSAHTFPSITRSEPCSRPVVGLLKSDP